MNFSKMALVSGEISCDVPRLAKHLRTSAVAALSTKSVYLCLQKNQWCHNQIVNVIPVMPMLLKGTEQCKEVVD